MGLTLPVEARIATASEFVIPIFQLSKLSVWRLRLGISIERIRPIHPQQNGRDERMHLTLKKEATRRAPRQHPAAAGNVRHLHRRINRECPDAEESRGKRKRAMLEQKIDSKASKR